MGMIYKRGKISWITYYGAEPYGEERRTRTRVSNKKGGPSWFTDRRGALACFCWLRFQSSRGRDTD